MYLDKFSRQNVLNRSLVSFQGNKSRAVYRWYKYKEAFSADLVEFLLEQYQIRSGVLLDPFAGSGTALFASSAMGLSAEGIELLPIGQEIIATKRIIDQGLDKKDLDTLFRWAKERPWHKAKKELSIPELRITKGAYPEGTAQAMGKFLAASSDQNNRVATILRFALLCILESISFTRKDGQYLRWDHRSGRRQGKKVFDKGRILSFDEAMQRKLHEIVTDLQACNSPADLFSPQSKHGAITLHSGSCLDLLPQFAASSYDCLVTSPPYCNRYDYTRTYALELALLGVGEEGLSRLRQQMLSCTVENRTKDLIAMNPKWKKAISSADRQKLLQAILAYLEAQRDAGALNNNGIPRMVRGYFYEMSCAIFECARVLKQGAHLMMVNDNVRYAGASISVDIILSDIAADLGFRIERILVLPNGKGNSSQQMGVHGRHPLRKCVYIWCRK
jgi:DNA modification methylase